MTAITEQITNPSVIDAVRAHFQQRRCFSQHWDSYMSPEQRRAFSNNLAAFVQACRTRYQWLTQ